MRKSIISILFFCTLGMASSSVALAQNDCANHFVFQNTAPNPVILETELNLMTKFRPFVTTYPFVNPQGKEVLVVMDLKFPLSKLFPIAEIPTPQTLWARFQNTFGAWPQYFYFGKDDLGDILAAKKRSDLKINFAQLNQARVVLFPYIDFPRIEDEDDDYGKKHLGGLHRAYLRTVIEAMHKLGFKSQLGELLQDWYIQQKIIHQDDNEALITKLTEMGDKRFHNGYGRDILRVIQQCVCTQEGETYVWTSEDTYRNPRVYRKKEQIRQTVMKLMDDDSIEQALHESGRLMEERKKLRQQGHSEDEIEEILYPDPEQRAARRALSAKLQSHDWFRVDDP